MQRRKTSRRSQADLGEVGEKPPFGYLLAPPLLTDTTAVTGDSQWLLRLFTRDVHTWGTRVYPQLAQITPSAPTCRGSAVGAASARLGITSVLQLTTRGRKRRARAAAAREAAREAWMRNVQLGLFAIPLQCIAIAQVDGGVAERRRGRIGSPL